MKYVYLLRSISHPDLRYVGFTSDLEKRLAAHSSGQSPHTAKFRPWQLVSYSAFADETKAVAFERHLKSDSGRAFANNHLCWL